MRQLEVFVSESLGARRDPLWVVELGRTHYADTWLLQKGLLKARHDQLIANTVLLTEHEHVLTIGRGAHKKNILVPEESLREKNIDVFHVERGGDITYHGPGQAVIYPIIDLNLLDRDLHRYLRTLEKVGIAVLKQFGLTATTYKGRTGVWVGEQKVAAIGVAVSRWVSYHGLAMNVTTNLEYFNLIIPCGLHGCAVGSIASLTGCQVDVGQVNRQLAQQLAEELCLDPQPKRLEELTTLLEAEKPSPDFQAKQSN